MEEKYQRDFKGVWIPKEIWLNRDLSIMEKLFLVEIDSLDNEQGCFASNKHFSDFFDISKGRCTQIIKSLEEKGLVSIKHEYKGKQIIRRTIRVVNKINRVDSELNEVDSKLNGGSKKTKQGYLENDEDNNTFNNPINNAYNNKQTKKTRHKYGDNQNVLMTKEEHDKLSEKFPNDLEKRINNLSYYMASTGKKYKSHYMTIIAWARRDKETTQNKPLDLDNVFDETDNSDQWARWEERKNASNR